MGAFAWILLIAGIGFLLFQIFVNQGSKAKFKSDLPKPKKGDKHDVS